MTAINDIMTERARQIEEEGWSAEHDDKHTGGELASAAAAYTWGAACSAWHHKYGRENAPPGIADKLLSLWPWDQKWFKPKTPRQDLTRAGALILAEIERLDRAAPTDGREPGSGWTISEGT